MKNEYSLSLIPGDGIGVDVVEECRKVLMLLGDISGTTFRFKEYEWGCEYYLKTGKMMPDDGLAQLRDSDVILLGAVGFPGVPDHVSLRELLLPIRKEFDQYVNLRPVKLLKGLESPLRIEDGSQIDFVVVRENTEGEYCGRGRIENEGTENETVLQESVFTYKATERIIRYAFDLARKTGKKRLCSATKSNALNYSMVFWDKVFDQAKQNYPGIETTTMHVDALAGQFILKPQMFDVVVASNLFGDILTDLGSAMLGSIGISPSANINPERIYPSMFEPIHGSAPDIAGKGIANPIGGIWSVVMMLDHLGCMDLSELLMDSMREIIAEGAVRTPDIGGTSKTYEVVDAICSRISQKAD